MHQHTEVERSVQELVAQNQELVAENRRLQQRIEDLDSFAQTAAHDLRNPISAIRLRASILRRYRDKHHADDIIHAATSIVEESVRLEEILEAILLFSRADSEMQIELKPINMPEIVERAINRLQKIIMRANAHVQINDEEWPLVLGHAPWIEQIWMNYISNAVKYGGEPPLIELGAKVQGNGVGVFWVRDNGVGLTEEQKGQIFQPYIRLHQDKADGHGLGLAIVERIARKLGGNTGVESVPGMGSKFKFMLPTV